jgi:hypothetical protein
MRSLWSVSSRYYNPHSCADIVEFDIQMSPDLPSALLQAYEARSAITRRSRPGRKLRFAGETAAQKNMHIFPQTDHLQHSLTARRIGEILLLLGGVPCCSLQCLAVKIAEPVCFRIDSKTTDTTSSWERKALIFRSTTTAISHLTLQTAILFI